MPSRVLKKSECASPLPNWLGLPNGRDETRSERHAESDTVFGLLSIALPS